MRGLINTQNKEKRIYSITVALNTNSFLYMQRKAFCPTGAKQLVII